METCPECGKKTVMHGFGLMGGGFGSYAACTAKGCTFFFKEPHCPVCDTRLQPDGSCEDCGTPEQQQALLRKLYPARCGACQKVTTVRLPDGRCGNMCSDGEPCGGDGSPVVEGP